MATTISSSVRTTLQLKPSSTHRNPTKETATVNFSFTKFIHKSKLFATKHTKNLTAETKKSSPETIFHSLDLLISAFLDPPLPSYLDPTHVLSGNFSPTNELPPTACHVAAGALPPALDGVYIRNGPNPQFFPNGPHHLFDGDGMLHVIKISSGKATLCSRFVQTYKYLIERETGHPIFPSVFSSFNGIRATAARSALFIARLLMGQFAPRAHGFGTANTSVGLLCGRLYAMCESDLPYAIEVTPCGDVVTLGRHNFHSREPFWSMTAHPKVDPTTGKVFAYGYNVLRPYLTYFRVGPDGRKEKEVPILCMKRASFIHDFAITEKYVIFPDTKIVMEPAKIVRGKPPMRVDLHKKPRLGILPRYGLDGSEMSWVEVGGLNVLHVVNAWEEDGGDTVVMVGSNVLRVEHSLGQMDLIHLSLEKIRIDVKGKRVVTRCPISRLSLDFGVLNSKYAGKKNRYIFAAMMDPMPKVAGVVKLDLSLPEADCTVASRTYGPGRYGGEPFFVSREPDNPDADEDDGYLVTLLHDENAEKSSFIVMDAKSPDLDIVAEVMLPGRVPYGFHGIFVKENDLNNLKKSH